jgi:hypothetical protein
MVEIQVARSKIDFMRIEVLKFFLTINNFIHKIVVKSKTHYCDLNLGRRIPLLMVTDAPILD